MNRLGKKRTSGSRRADRTRSSLKLATDKPRLSAHISNQHITAQIIDDSRSATLAYTTTVGQKKTGSLSQRAEEIGAEIAQKSKKAGVKKVSFDRGRRKYHGRIKKLADAARAGGLEF